MTKILLILFSLVVCLNSWGISHAECEALKSDITSRLDTIDYTVSYSLSYIADIDDIILNTYTARFSNTDPTDPGTYQSTDSTYYYDSSGNFLGTLDDIHIKLNSVRSDFQVITNNTAYIRGLLLSVNCDDTASTNGCNCAEQLSIISQQVDSIFGVLSENRTDFIQLLSDFYTWEELWEAQNEAIISMFDNVNVFLTLYTNSYLRAFLLSTGTTNTDIPNLSSPSELQLYYKYNELSANLSGVGSSPNTRASGKAHLWNFLNTYGNLVPRAVSSLNRWSNAHWLQLNQLTNTVSSVDTNVSEVVSRFSIFNDFVFSSDAPLSMYTDMQTDGSYHDYLTNYYIKVSKVQQSGSDSFTNWFSRVELLLAALVFQDEDDSTINTNGVPSESDKNSVTEVGSSLGQTISGFVQDGNSHVSSVDTSGKSIIRMVTSWNTAIGQTAKPSPFVVAEFSTPDSQSRSNISLWLDTEDEKLSSLIEIGHGISTLAWVSVFLLLGYNLAVYSIRVLRRLISFSFSLYSAIFGGG